MEADRTGSERPPAVREERRRSTEDRRKSGAGPERLQKVRVAAVADLHYRETKGGMYRELFERLSSEADIVALCGDLTDHGLASEAQVLAQLLENLFSMPESPLENVTRVRR